MFSWSSGYPGSSNNIFDVIIMDVYMPGLDGLSPIKRIRTLPNGHIVPIIVITAYDCSEREAHEAGANLLLKKPILQRALVQHVERLHATTKS